MRVAEELALARLHVFRYSPRQGTAAARMTDAATAEVARQRSERLIALGEELALAYHRRFIGQTVQVLFETPVKLDGLAGWSGLTDHYLRVWAPSDQDLHNRLASVRCLAADADGLRGELT